MEAGTGGTLHANVWWFSEIFLLVDFKYLNLNALNNKIANQMTILETKQGLIPMLESTLNWELFIVEEVILLESTPITDDSVCFAAVHCPPPPEVKGAEMSDPVYEHVPFGHAVSYHCRTGAMIGARDIYCTQEGTWNAPPPECKGTDKL